MYAHLQIKKKTNSQGGMPPLHPWAFHHTSTLAAQLLNADDGLVQQVISTITFSMQVICTFPYNIV